MADPDPADYDSLPGASQQGDAPLRITVYPQRAAPRFVPVDHDPFADDGAADRGLTRLGVGGVPNRAAGSWGSNPAFADNTRFPDAQPPDAESPGAEPRPIAPAHDPFSDREFAAGVERDFMQRQRELLRQRAVLDSLYGETRSDIARLIAGDDVAGTTNAMKAGVTARRPAEMRTYHPSRSERVKYALSDAQQFLGVKPYEANHLAGGVTDLIGLTPVGVAFAANDMQRAAERHDYPGAAMAALGVIPVVRPAAKAARARTAFATHEAIPGADIGHLPGFVNADEATRAAFSADPRSTWATAPGGRDSIYAGMNTPGTGAHMRVQPTTEMQGLYTPRGGVTETNPGWTARPLVSFETGPTRAISAGDRAALNAAEATRGYVDAQDASAWHVVWRGGPAEQADSLFIPMSRKATKEELIALEGVGKANGLPRAIDSGTGVTLTNFSAQPLKLSGSVVDDVRSIVPNSFPERVRMDSDYVNFARAREKGAGSGALTKLWLSYINKMPELRAAINSNPEVAKKALGNLHRDEEWVSKVGATSTDIQNARRIIGEGPGFVDRIEAAFKTGSFLPALAVGLFGAGSLSEPRTASGD